MCFLVTPRTWYALQWELQNDETYSRPFVQKKQLAFLQLPARTTVLLSV
jgi:hypothetical protein